MDYIAVEKIIAPALNTMAGGPSWIYKQTTHVIEEAANALAIRAIASGDLRPDVDPMDILRAIYRVSVVGTPQMTRPKRLGGSLTSSFKAPGPYEVAIL